MSHAIDACFFADLPRETTFYIVRHGESHANAQNRIQGRTDIALNDAGRAQAAALGAWFRGKPVARVLHSPLVRAAETASILSREAGLQAPESEELLIELDTGAWSNLSIDEIRERFPEHYEAFRGRSWAGVPSAESASDLGARATAAWGRLKAAAAESGGDVVAVSHGGMIQWLFRVTFGLSSWMPLVMTGNCAVFELCARPNGPGEPAHVVWKRVNETPGDSGPRAKPVF